MNRNKWCSAVVLAFASSLLACDRPGRGHSNDEQGGHSDEDHEDHAPHSDEGHDHHGEAGGDHGHGEDAIGITKFTEKLELFAEHPPAISGQELTFLAHLTVLDGFQGLNKAKVKLVLDGPEKVQAEVKEKLRPGIFPLTLKAPQAGAYKCRLLVSGPEVEDTIDGFEIVVYPTKAAAAQAAPKEDEGPEPISFLKEQQWQVPFGTAFATDGTVVPTIEVAGEVTTPPAGQADVGAAITGRVVAPSQGLPRPGQAVKKGELLATIAPAPAAPEEAARAGLAVVEAKARLQTAQANVERAERLIKDKAISQREVDEAQRELGVAKEAVSASQRASAIFAGAASGSGAGTYRVTSPIDGVVVDLQTTAGKSVNSGDLLLRVVSLDELWIKAQVPEQDAARLRSDQDGAYKLAGTDTWKVLGVTGAEPPASVVNIGQTVDKRSRTVEIIYALANPDPSLRVGGMVRVAVPAGEPWKGVIVPRGAVVDDSGRSVVYVQLEGEAFEERVVALGPSAGAHVGIVRGVAARERIVTVGANVVRLTSRASSAPAHGHVR